jgi:hypothetical protein
VKVPEPHTLDFLNARLASVEADLEAPFDTPEKTLFFFVGAPRSGKTVASQVLSMTGAVGYVTNFVARFWEAPRLGILLHAALDDIDQAWQSDLESEFGVTAGWREPHEFGYFWNRWFDIGETGTHKLTEEELKRVDTTGMKRALASMEEALGKPMVFKNATWCDFQISFMAALFPRAIFIHTKRDPHFVCQSILQLRERHAGSREAWISLKPPQYGSLANKPWPEQIAGQVYYTVREIESALSQLDPGRVVVSDYLSFCKSPRTFVDTVFAAAKAFNGELLSPKQAVVSHLDSTDEIRISSEDFATIRTACQTYESIES